MTNILYISLDSVRNDCLSDENSSEIYPTLYNLSNNGLLFENTIVQVPFTVPSHTSMFTGKYPFNHGVRDQLGKLDTNILTLFDILKSHGFEISSFSDVSILADRGFDWNYCGTCTIKNIGNKIKEVAHGNFFIFVHYWGTHTPYKTKFDSKNIVDFFANTILKINNIKNVPILNLAYKYFWLYNIKRMREMLKTGNREIVTNIKKGYSESISEADKFIGKLIEILTITGILHDTLIVITADHGESFNEHDEIDSIVDGRYEHGQTLYDNVLKVPLIFYQPSQLAPTKVETQVREIDILPTILEILKLDNVELIESNFDGNSLLPLVYENKKSNHPEHIYSEVVRKDLAKNVEKRSLRTNDYKLIIDYIKNEKELYNLNIDPDEMNNIYEIKKDIAAELTSLLYVYLTKNKSKNTRDKIKEKLHRLKSNNKI